MDDKEHSTEQNAIIRINYTLEIPEGFPVSVDFSDSTDPKKMVKDGPERCPKMIKDTITMLKGLSSERFSEAARYVFRLGFRRLVDLPGMVNIVQARQYIYDHAPVDWHEYIYYRAMTGYNFFPDEVERLRFGLFEVERAMLSSLSDGIGIFKEALFTGSFLAGLFDNENIRVYATETFYEDWCKFADMIERKGEEGQGLVERLKTESSTVLKVVKKRRTWNDFVHRKP